MRYPVCAREAELPCRCQLLFDGLAAEMEHVKSVEAHRGGMAHGARMSIQERMVKAWLNHTTGLHLIDPRELDLDMIAMLPPSGEE